MVAYLLHIDDIIAILREISADLLGILSFCSIDIVGVQDGGQASDVEAQRGKATTGCCRVGGSPERGPNGQRVLHYEEFFVSVLVCC